MFTAKVYRIMVGSLSGAVEEVYIAKEIIRKWNQQNAERTGRLFMPIEWASGLEVIQNVDVIVGIIDNWLDDPKLVEESIEVGKRVMLLFNAVNDPINSMQSELESVRSLWKKCHTRCYCVSYSDMKELESLLSKQLEAF